ncbi:MAG: potassium channel protein [Phycisphaerales bacterium]|nr:MAG: potassium channel protein [Phycisphaerales bacterium]
MVWLRYPLTPHASAPGKGRRAKGDGAKGNGAKGNGAMPGLVPCGPGRTRPAWQWGLMRSVYTQILTLTRERSTKRNLVVLARFFMFLVGMIAFYSVLFHVIMGWEGQEHSWVSGLYWTLTTMSTLGYGDITFHSDLGRVFSILVILSGTLFLLVLLPFTFIQFFYAPWIEAQAAARTPRSLPKDLAGHVLLTRYDAVADSMIRRLKRFDIPYTVLTPDIEEAQRLSDRDVHIMVGELDDPETYSRAGVSRAAMVVATRSDAENTMIAFTVGEVSKSTPVVATAEDPASARILESAGATTVVSFTQVMGQALARCITGSDAVTHVVGEFDELLIAEANAGGTPLVGKTLRENRLSDLDVSVIGVWDRGDFQHATPDTIVGQNTVLLLVGSAAQLQNYDEHFAIYNVSTEPVLILGGGRIGRATAVALTERGVQWRMVELRPERVFDAERTIVGNAAEPDVLEQAGIERAPTVIITTHDDNVNLYLTLLCRKLRPNMEIICRSTLERHVPALHHAGADFVQSHASIASGALLTMIRGSRVVTVAEGLDVFRVKVSQTLSGKTLGGSGIREHTGCTVVAYRTASQSLINPPADTKLESGNELVLVGTWESRDKFTARFGQG